MAGFLELVRENRNYRRLWLGQVVSEIGDHFNNIAVFSLAVQHPNSGLAVSGVLLARAVPAILAGPVAGVLLDRYDRRRIMIGSDLIRAAVAAAFITTLESRSVAMLYLLSALLMLASPFFTSGRASILPSIATPEQLHAANSLTQTTQWTTLTLGTLLGGASVASFGYAWAFLLNAMSFVFSAWCVASIRAETSPAKRAAGARRTTRACKQDESGSGALPLLKRPFHEYLEGLRYIRRTPLLLGVTVINMGWATGGGAAQILFSLFGENVFHRGAAGIGTLWSCAGCGLLLGGALAHRIGPRLSFDGYKRMVAICYIVHGAAYVLFSQMRSFTLALVFIALSRLAVGITSVLNFSQLLHHVRYEFRGRVFATLETVTWAVMMVSMLAAGLASQRYPARTIATWSGIFSSLTAFYWITLHAAGRLPEPATDPEQPQERNRHEFAL